MKQPLLDIQQEAARIRQELGARFGLAPNQIAALPSLEELNAVAAMSLQEILPLFFESFMTQKEHDWLEKGPFAPEDIFDEMAEPREVTLNQAEQNQFELLNKLGHFHVTLLFAQINPAKSALAATAEHDEEKLNALSAYEEICSELIKSRNNATAEGSHCAYFLSRWFAIPPDHSVAPKPRKKGSSVRAKGPHNLKKPEM